MPQDGHSASRSPKDKPKDEGEQSGEQNGLSIQNPAACKPPDQAAENVLQTSESFHTDAEQAEPASAQYGKFQSAQDLLCAYNALEGAFTKRCQKLKELTGEVQRLQEAQASEEAVHARLRGMLDDRAFVKEHIAGNRLVQRQVIEAYLRALEGQAKGLNVLSGNCGYTMLTPAEQPKTLKEAKQLADILLNK